MNQSRLSSFIEATINTLIGFWISIVLSMLVYPLFGHTFSIAQNIGITAVFTIASILRGYIVRRWFNGRMHDAVKNISRYL